MRVCIITAFPPQKGNLSEYASYLVNSLEKEKIIKEIIILANKTNEAREKEENGKIKVIRCWKNNDFLLIFRILKKLRECKCKLVFVNCHMASWGKRKIVNFFGALLVSFLKLLGYKVIVDLHNILEAVNLEEIGIKKNFLTLLGSFFATRSLLNADKVIVHVKRFIFILKKKYGKDNLVYIPHGTLGAKVKKPRIGGKRVLTFGFWSHTKNLPLLIEAFKELQRREKKLKLIVAGSTHPNYPNYLEKIKRKYKDVKNLYFTGYIPEDKIGRIFLSSTLVVLPYKTATGSSGVIHLASSYGKPIIVTDLPEMREIIKEEGISLVLVANNDKEALKRAIKRIINDKDLQKRMGERNLKAAEKLSFYKLSKKFVNIFREVLK